MPRARLDIDREKLRGTEIGVHEARIRGMSMTRRSSCMVSDTALSQVMCA